MSLRLGVHRRSLAIGGDRAAGVVRSTLDLVNKNPRAVLDAASAASARLEKRGPAEVVGHTSPLISWAAFHLGAAFAAEVMIERLGTEDGWHDLQRVLGVNSYDIMEAQAFIVASSSVMTAIDLCAAAVYRLSGGTPAPGREYDLGDWRRHGDRDETPPALQTWLSDVLRSAEQSLLERARHQAVHRSTPRVIKLTAGAHRLPASEFVVDGTAHPVDDLIARFARHGENRFDAFCDSVASDYT